MNKKFFALVSALILSVFALSACGAAQTAQTTPPATYEPIVTEPTTEPAVVSVSPAAGFTAYDDFVNSAPEGDTIVRIEGYYTYILNVKIVHGNRYYSWYEANYGENWDASGYSYAKGYFRGNMISPITVQQNWTQITVNQSPVVEIGPSK